MEFDEKTNLYAYEVKREGGEDVLYINYLGAPFVPSVSEYPEVMEMVVDYLIKNSLVSNMCWTNTVPPLPNSSTYVKLKTVQPVK